MRIGIHSVGRFKKGPEREIVDRYLQRAGKLGSNLGLEIRPIREVPEAQNGTVDERRSAEAQGLSRGLSDRAAIVALDETGTLVTSVEFADLLARLRDDGVPEAGFLIGGADGLDPSLLAGAKHTVALGRLTWPHLLVRVLLSEQIYRATTILSGHPYHRG
ncbi:23S rRNA (pseudouridine(1915)-N(3))-methyltransferase RlmH [Amorphus orientalis]|uniref:Ribosomal RNA large subunit methyltransferase H n=1 Tax=Amorphus orientalis TaxID=649198 RepID=A0AAE3VM33_9HYPH|nr:23S rRNA (pseudouridine(1915)-N(3))-methyltransferase RlmH [Amorphus orientalis]MDQ0314629.1 23S rRNA (pseudouridine1915-N3)-methyltransferase [Amorphus orientalis]